MTYKVNEEPSPKHFTDNLHLQNPHLLSFNAMATILALRQNYFTEVWVNRDESSLDSEIFSDLPSYLRARVAQYITTDLVLQVRGGIENVRCSRLVGGLQGCMKGGRGQGGKKDRSLHALHERRQRVSAKRLQSHHA